MSTPTLDQLRRDPAVWDEARAAWLGSKSPNTRDIYTLALDQFFEFADKRPWAVAGRDVIAWQTALRDRGLAETTVNLKLSALSSYYRYCSHKYTLLDPATGAEVPLAPGNPAARPQRTKIKPYGKTSHLDAAEVKALLRAVDRSTLVGLRDYALLLAYLYTGRRRDEIRRLRWRDISVVKNRCFYTWSGKGGTGREDELPWPVYHAIADWLKAAGRWEPGPDDYIFTPTTDVARRLPCVRKSRSPEDLCSRPLSPSMVNRVVKKAARRAGLRAGLVHTHTLRHTAAMLRRGLTDDLQEIQQFLDHDRLSTTQIYIQHTRKRRDNLWMKVQALIGID